MAVTVLCEAHRCQVETASLGRRKEAARDRRRRGEIGRIMDVSIRRENSMEILSASEPQEE